MLAFKGQQDTFSRKTIYSFSCCASFFDAHDSIEAKFNCMRAPYSDDLNIDHRIDIAFRNFLLRVDALRRRHTILLLAILSHNS